MKKVLFKNINHLLEIDNVYKIITFESIKQYRNMYYNLIDEIIFSIDGKEYSVEKNVLLLNNPLELEVNTKKNITNLYKSIDKQMTEDNIILFESLLEKINDFMSKIIFESDYHLEYNDELDVTNLFDVMELKYSLSNKTDYIKQLVQYIDIMKKINNYKLIITYNLIKYLTNREFDLLINELKLLEIELVDICTKDDIEKEIERIIVDEDLIII